jgi:hypothetical protein
MSREEYAPKVRLSARGTPQPEASWRATKKSTLICGRESAPAVRSNVRHEFGSILMRPYGEMTHSVSPELSELSNRVECLSPNQV